MRFFDSPEKLDYLAQALLVLAQEHELRLQAWAVFPNHYHLIAEVEQPRALVHYVRYLHSISAKYVNRLNESPGRKIWHQYWDTRVQLHRSLLARLKYVHTNPVKHRIVQNAELYEWCSAAWFRRTASRSFVKTVLEFPSDNLAIPDEYD